MKDSWTEPCILCKKNRPKDEGIYCETCMDKLLNSSIEDATNPVCDPEHVPDYEPERCSPMSTQAREMELRTALIAPIKDLIAYHEKYAKDHVSSQWIYGEHMMAVRSYKKVLEMIAALASQDGETPRDVRKSPVHETALSEAIARRNEAKWWNERTVGAEVKNSELDIRMAECEEAVRRLRAAKDL